MMDKRKLKITTSHDGKTTTIRNKYGSGYNKESILLNTSTVTDDWNELKEITESLNATYDPIQLIASIEKAIINFLESRELPTEDRIHETSKSEGGSAFSMISLPKLLKEEHANIIGAIQASACLLEIVFCKKALENDDNKKGITHALRLALSFQRFTFAILESTLALGESRQEGMISSNTKLTNQQYDLSIKYFKSLDTTNEGRKLNEGEKWDKTMKFALDEFGVNISTQTLRKKQKK